MRMRACHERCSAVRPASQRVWRWLLRQHDLELAAQRRPSATQWCVAAFGKSDVAAKKRTERLRPSSLSCHSARCVLLAILMLLYSPVKARSQRPRDRVSLRDTHMLKIAGESIDTSTVPSVLHEPDPRRAAMSNVTFGQYYVQLKPNADQHELREVCSLLRFKCVRTLCNFDSEFTCVADIGWDTKDLHSQQCLPRLDFEGCRA